MFDHQPDLAGLTFWSDAISSGKRNPAAAALAIMRGASGNSAQGQADVQTIANRLNVAGNFTGLLSAQGLDDDYRGGSAATALRACVADIASGTGADDIASQVIDCISELSGIGTTGSPILNAVAWSGTQFVAVGMGGIVETSPDGVTWTNRGSAFTAPLSAASLRGIVWAGNRFLAVGANGGEPACLGTNVCAPYSTIPQDSVLSSSDGISWTNSISDASAASIPNNSELSSIAWSGSGFVAVGDQLSGSVPNIGDQGHALISSDGANWTAATQYGDPPTTLAAFLPALKSVAWSDSQFVAAGNGVFSSSAAGAGGALYSSPDGKTWTQHAATGADLFASTWSGSQFVVVGAGTILTSPGGAAWTVRSAATSNPLYGVAWSGSQFVAVGAGVAVTSPDGVTWTAHTVK